MNKALIFDASSLISLAMNGLFDELRSLKRVFNGKFLITKDVFNESIAKPLTIKRFELEAIRLNQLVEDKTLEFSNVDESQIQTETKKILELSNSMYKSKDEFVKMIDLGEASCLALSKILTTQKVPNLIVIDERTTRMLCESPNQLKKLLERKLHIRVNLQKDNSSYFKEFKIIRSCELIYVAFRKNLTLLKGKQSLDALLWALRFKGCSISDEEIKEIKLLKL